MLDIKNRWVRLSAGFAAATVLLWASGIAPQAYNLIQGNGTPATKGSTLNFNNTPSVTWVCSTTGIVTSCSATASGSGGSGGGIVTYSSGSAINPAGTQFVAIGGGGQSSTAESDVRIGAPSAATISAMFVNLDLAAGLGNSIAFTWRKAGASQTLTCTISGAVATTCSDTTHSFTVAQGDLIDIQMVTTGTVLVAPGLTIATAYGTTGTAGYLTVENNGSPLPQEPVLNLINGTNTTYACADNPGNTSTDCKVNSSGGGGSFSVNGFYLNDGTNNYISPTNQIATLPSAGAYSWVNQGSATETTVQNALVVHAPAANTGISLNMRRSPISTTTTLTSAFVCSYAMNDTEATGCVIGFYEAGSGKAEGFQIVQGFVQVNRFASPTSFGANVLNANKAGSTTQVVWVRLTITGGVITFYYSLDGVNFAFAYSEASNAFFNTAPDNWFYGVDVQGPTNDAFTTLLSWKAVP